LVRMEDNVTLIGFMGAGKTTVGQRRAARLSRPFVDVDAVIEARAGMSIPDIFAAEGESGFRRREVDAVRRICREGGQVIAAGGRSEEHTSELQSREKLVCRLLLEKKKYNNKNTTIHKR